VRASIISASLALALTQVGPACAGEDLLRGCRAAVENRLFTPKDQAEGGACVGVIVGVAAGAVIQSRALNAPRPFCLPNASNDQLARVVIKYIDQHPEVMHWPFPELAYHALKDAWPCKP
jgi:hypothetical protein